MQLQLLQQQLAQGAMFPGLSVALANAATSAAAAAAAASSAGTPGTHAGLAGAPQCPTAASPVTSASLGPTVC